MMTLFRRLMGPAIILMLSGYAILSGCALAGKTVKASAIFSSLEGEGLGETPGAAWIDDNEEYVSFMNRIRRLRLGGVQSEAPAEDFDSEGVLIIWMGRKPTGGYKIELAHDRIYIKDHTAVVTVRWTEPAEGAVLTQRITGPCIMISMSRGDYTRIKVIDEEGIIRAETLVDTGEE